MSFFKFLKKNKIAKTVGMKEIIVGFDLSLKKGFIILNYVGHLLTDYPNNPAGALKEIPLNLKSNERYLAVFVLGNQYAPTFKDMQDEEMTEFLATIADEIDIGTDKIDPVLTYIVERVLEMREQSIIDVIKNILSSKFSEKEKDFILFSFGILSRI